MNGYANTSWQLSKEALNSWENNALTVQLIQRIEVNRETGENNADMLESARRVTNIAGDPATVNPNLKPGSAVLVSADGMVLKYLEEIGL